MAALSQFLQFAANGVVVGSILTLAAVGLTLVYGILHLANFAHGDLVTLGAYLGLFFTALIPSGETVAWALGASAILAVTIVADRFVRPWIAEDSEPALSSTEIGVSLAGIGLLGAIMVGMELGLDVADGWLLALAAAIAAGGMLWTGRDRLSGRWSDAVFALAGTGAVLVGLGLVVPLVPSEFGLPLGWTVGIASVPILSLGVEVAGGRLDAWPARGGLAAAGAIVAAGFGSRFLLGVTLAILMAMALTVLLDLTIWRYLRSREAGLVTLLIASIGLALALRHAIMLQWGAGLRTYPGPVHRAQPVLGTSITLTNGEIATILISLATIAIVHILLRHTRIGKAMRALSDDKELARITGIDVDRVILYLWLIAGGMAALAGILLGNLRSFTPTIGWLLLLPIFAAVILGGIGSPYGAIAGGMTIGIAMEVSPAFGIPTAYKSAVGFVILIAVLLIRPQGIFGGQATR